MFITLTATYGTEAGIFLFGLIVATGTTHSDRASTAFATSTLTDLGVFYPSKTKFVFD